MKYIADIHIHSYYSRATSKKLNLEHLNKWAQLKGLTVVASGDITHPKWLEEMRTKLEPASQGLFKLKKEYAVPLIDEVYPSCAAEVFFLLSGEISSIYKKGDKVRKVHNVAFMPSFDAVERLQNRLETIGNIRSDGRPILGLDSRDLLEILLETDEKARLIPAHIWTPWFSMLGSKSGFDTVQECFDDLTPFIFALETGLSSDPPMNWRLSMLDGYTLVSNSDAHSPEKLAREANVFETELSYDGLFAALQNKQTNDFWGTIEFFPEEGKYHMDGHRNCQRMMRPGETMQRKGLCPECGKPVTIGVSYRVEELADRPEGDKPDNTKAFLSLVPLPEVLSEVVGSGPNSKKVQQRYQHMLQRLGPELKILMDIPIAEIERTSGDLVAEAVRRMRRGEVHPQPGYDGEFGIIRIFSENERQQITHQGALFSLVRQNQSPQKERAVQPPAPGISASRQAVREVKTGYGLNDQQQQAVEYEGNALIIQAGPGTGKTGTLTHRIARMINNGICKPENILAVTFTNKAADEMRERLRHLVGEAKVQEMTISTFHSFGARLMREHPDLLPHRSARFSIIDPARNKDFQNNLLQTTGVKINNAFIERISWLKSQMIFADDVGHLADQNLPEHLETVYRQYELMLHDYNCFDYEDLILIPVQVLRKNPDLRRRVLSKYATIFVDEFQDINRSQYELFKIFAIASKHCCVIGDPDQAIYGFRGASREFFLRFHKDFPSAKLIRLQQNYRSAQNIITASLQMLARDEERNVETELWSNISPKIKITIQESPTDRAEAEFIVHQIEQMVGGTSHFSIDSRRLTDEAQPSEFGFADFAVLLRSRRLLPPLEEALGRSGIPFEIFSDSLFIEQPIVKALYQLLLFAHMRSEPYINPPPVEGVPKESVISFLSQSEFRADGGIVALVESAWRFLQKCFPEEVDAKLKSGVLQLAAPFENRLSEFLDALALKKQADHYKSADRVSILTLHASKGLEFPVVFIPACEQNIIPFTFFRKRPDIAEERRLLYVAMTRAQRSLILTHARSRLLYGQRHQQKPSPFLAAISENLIKRMKAFQPSKGRRTDQLSLF